MNFDYIVVFPEKVREAYNSGKDGLAEHWDVYLAWAEDADQKYEAAITAKREKEKQDAEAEKAERKRKHDEYEAKWAIYQFWSNLPWLVRVFTVRPDVPSYPSHSSYSDFFGGYRSYSGGRKSQVETAKQLKTEAEEMIAAAKSEPKEFHFTEDQFARMQQWGNGEIVDAVLKRMKSGASEPMFYW